MTAPSDDQPRRPKSADRGWAPWWIYVVVIVGGNFLRQVVIPFGTVPELVDVMIALALAGVLFVVVTAAHRVSARRHSASPR